MDADEVFFFRIGINLRGYVAKRRPRRSPVGQGAFILSKSSLVLGGNFMFLPFQMAIFIQLLGQR
jgi:hypothetical protein